MFSSAENSMGSESKIRISKVTDYAALNASAAMAPTTSTLQKTCFEESNVDDTPYTVCSILLEHDMSRTGKSTLRHDSGSIIFPSKGLHI